jgi:hypothetical protein
MRGGLGWDGQLSAADLADVIYLSTASTVEKVS